MIENNKRPALLVQASLYNYCFLQVGAQFYMVQHMDLSRVARDLATIVGREHLSFDAAVCRTYARSTLSKGTLPIGVVYPRNTEQVAAIVRVARQHQLPFHPISTGKNWGYSDASAPKDGALIFDLKRMNAIVEVDDTLGFATIEPGVTQGQLHSYLETHHPRLWMDATGAGPDTSIIGNITQRGFGHSPYGDRFAHSCAYEIVLPSGEVLHTGFGGGSEPLVARLYKWGSGPSLDGLFTQSNLGIVTRMTIWLMPKPEDFRVLFFSLCSEQDIGTFIDRIRPLRMDGTLTSVVHISNDLRTVASFQTFPFDEAAGDAFLSKELRTRLLRKTRLGHWVGFAGFYRSRSQNRTDIARVRNALRGISGLHTLVVTERFVRVVRPWVEIAARLPNLNYIKQIYDKLTLSVGLLKGKSPRGVARGVLWKVPPERVSLIGETPIDYGAGIYWVSPILPMRGVDALRLTAIAEPIFNRYGFDCFQTLSCISGRALCAVLAISFDQKDALQSARARQCHDEVVAALKSAGYPLYRAGNHAR